MMTLESLDAGLFIDTDEMNAVVMELRSMAIGGTNRLDFLLVLFRIGFFIG